MAKFKVGDIVQFDKDSAFNKNNKELPYGENFKITAVDNNYIKIIGSYFVERYSDWSYGRFKLAKKHYFDEEIKKILR